MLLLPRQIMCESAGTCYEEYVQDASRHYHNWISKTVDFDWPVEALSNTDVQPHIDTGQFNVFKIFFSYPILLFVYVYQL